MRAVSGNIMTNNKIAGLKAGKFSAVVANASPVKSRSELKAIVRDNQLAGRNSYQGLTSSEIGEYNRSLMFGDNDEAFPGQEEWSSIVD